MNNLMKALAFFTLMVGGQVHASELFDITIKNAGFLKFGTFSVFSFEPNENVVLENCPGFKTLQISQEGAPDTKMTTIISMVLAAQAQGMKMNVSYTGCNGYFGPDIQGVNMHR